jgi:hypothetical protein
MKEPLDQEEQLYLEQMQEWLKEQERIENQLIRAIDDHKYLANSNTLQLTLHRKRVEIGRNEFEQWKTEHGIE